MQKPRDYGWMDSALYIEALGLDKVWADDSGDQSLLLPDILACFKDCHSIALPYRCHTLELYLVKAGKFVVRSLQGAEGVYWGTPTVVDDEALFPKSLEDGEGPGKWTVEYERGLSRAWTDEAEQCGLKVIVTGLGTGDISPEMRLVDMKGGTVVSYKRFQDFEDWVLCRHLH